MPKYGRLDEKLSYRAFCYSFNHIFRNPIGRVSFSSWIPSLVWEFPFVPYPVVALLSPKHSTYFAQQSPCLFLIHSPQFQSQSSFCIQISSALVKTRVKLGLISIWNDKGGKVSKVTAGLSFWHVGIHAHVCEMDTKGHRISENALYTQLQVKSCLRKQQTALHTCAHACMNSTERNSQHLASKLPDLSPKYRPCVWWTNLDRTHCPFCCTLRDQNLQKQKCSFPSVLTALGISWQGSPSAVCFLKGVSLCHSKNPLLAAAGEMISKQGSNCAVRQTGFIGLWIIIWTDSQWDPLGYIYSACTHTSHVKTMKATNSLRRNRKQEHRQNTTRKWKDKKQCDILVSWKPLSNTLENLNDSRLAPEHHSTSLPLVQVVSLGVCILTNTSFSVLQGGTCGRSRELPRRGSRGQNNEKRMWNPGRGWILQNGFCAPSEVLNRQGCFLQCT